MAQNNKFAVLPKSHNTLNFPGFLRAARGPHAFPEGDILGQPDGLGIAAPERASLGDSHGFVHVIVMALSM
jgi:hypothetical protein